jgi:putative cofactor-binding repeat protein
MNKTISLLIFLIIWHPLLISAGTIRVPGDQPTIQAGIDAASNGDIVLVADGTYTGTGNRDIDFNGKAITVKSENGAEFCVIDCEADQYDNHRGFYFHHSEGKDSVVEGFTIRNGWYYYYGAGIYCDGASPTINQNIITAGNDDFDWLEFFNPIQGGGIYLYASNAVVTGNVISANKATWGGGIYCTGDGSPLIAFNLIRGNRSVYYPGGGICCWMTGADPVITNNIIEYNNAWEDSATGGGIFCGEGASPEIRNNIIHGNSSGYGSGGIVCWGGSSVIGNNLITGNWDGAAIECYGSILIINCTLTNHCYQWYGEGIRCDSNVTIVNSVLWHNGTAEIVGSPTVTYSNIEGGYAGAGNINADPLFIKGPRGIHYLSQIAAGQSEDSPCVDAGDGPVEWPCLPFTVCGTTRTDIAPDAGIIDMGYHYPLVGVQIPPGQNLKKAP